MRLVSELNFADEQRRDQEGCATVLGDAGNVGPGAAVTLWEGARCSFAFASLSQGDRVELLFGMRVLNSCVRDAASEGC